MFDLSHCTFAKTSKLSQNHLRNWTQNIYHESLEHPQQHLCHLFEYSNVENSLSDDLLWNTLFVITKCEFNQESVSLDQSFVTNIQLTVSVVTVAVLGLKIWGQCKAGFLEPNFSLFQSSWDLLFNTIFFCFVVC